MTSVSGPLGQDLQRVRADAGDEVGLVPGMDVSVALLGGLLLALLACVVEVAAVENDLRAERAHRLDLDGIGVLGHEDGGPHAEQVGRVRDGLAVIARRGRGDAALALGAAELTDQVHAAAHLERPDREVVLVLDPQPRAGYRIQRGISIQGRWAQVRGDAVARRQDVGQVRDVRCGHGLVLPRPRMPARMAVVRARGA